MNLKEAISILNEHNYNVKPLKESDLRFDSADQFLSFTQAKGYYQNSVKIANINTMLSEKELNNTGNDIGEVIIEHYCKKNDTEMFFQHKKQTHSLYFLNNNNQI